MAARDQLTGGLSSHFAQADMDPLSPGAADACHDVPAPIAHHEVRDATDAPEELGPRVAIIPRRGRRPRQPRHRSVVGVAVGEQEAEQLAPLTDHSVRVEELRAAEGHGVRPRSLRRCHHWAEFRQPLRHQRSAHVRVPVPTPPMARAPGVDTGVLRCRGVALSTADGHQRRGHLPDQVAVFRWGPRSIVGCHLPPALREHPTISPGPGYRAEEPAVGPARRNAAPPLPVSTGCVGCRRGSPGSPSGPHEGTEAGGRNPSNIGAVAVAPKPLSHPQSREPPQVMGERHTTEASLAFWGVRRG